MINRILTRPYPIDRVGPVAADRTAMTSGAASGPPLLASRPFTESSAQPTSPPAWLDRPTLEITISHDLAPDPGKYGLNHPGVFDRALERCFNSIAMLARNGGDAVAIGSLNVVSGIIALRRQSSVVRKALYAG
ncbi:hypothetical protein [Bordetella genomosp. 9]|uniref:Uncharacterized protein n=1 Tax=Bordetella genomosp. 9 TaxID=1416803 RepID=A0A1W6YX85_9BORD|nr:hypothetical protein [Bordetella genomosp. 9]ARP85648.1 hypothetical protein CAL13_05065 [Bordetella genomosp. 9]